jgi:hypothetical protein
MGAMTKLNSNDNEMSAVVKMASGNIGTGLALTGILKEAAIIDPDNELGGFGALLSLDIFGIYGTDIYVLYSDICKRSLPKTLACIRGAQLGIISSKILRDACSRQDYSGLELLNPDDIYEKVRQQLPRFDFANTPRNAQIMKLASYCIAILALALYGYIAIIVLLA